MNYSTFLFDFDGTLADSYTAIASSVNYIRDLRELPPLPVEEVKRFVGRGPEHLLRNTVPNGDPAIDLARYRAHHPTVMVSQTQLLPGTVTLLRTLHTKGKTVGLCSNKPRLFSGDLLNHLGIGQYFHLVLGPEDVEKPKPAPHMLLAALRRLNVKASEVLYVGDMTVDIQTARGAGVAVWVVPTGSDERSALEAEKPDRLLNDLNEMLTLI